MFLMRLVTAAIVLGPILMILAAAAPMPKHDWYQLNFEDGQCHRLADDPSLPQTPQAMHEQLRSMGVVDQVQVEKTPDGTVFGAMISFSLQGAPVGLAYFVDGERCETARIIFRQNGNLPDKEDDDLN